MKNNFEEFIRQSVERQDPVEYNPAHWDRIEKELDKKRGTTRYIIGGVLLAGVLTAGLILMTPEESTTTSTNTTGQPKPAAQKTQTVSPTAVKTTYTSTGEVVSTQANTTETSKTEPVSVPSAAPAMAMPAPAANEPTAPVVVTKRVSEGNVVASIKVSKTNGCAGEAFYFVADVNVPSTYLWTFGDGKTSTLPNPSHTYAQAGKYGVNLKVTSVIDGKTTRIPEGALILVNAKPTARFNYTVDEDANFSRIVEFGNLTKDNIGSQWIVDGKYYNEDEPRVKINRKGNYPVSWIVKNSLGCYDTLTQGVSVEKDYNLLAPNAFTPNDDNQNDDFLPAALRNTDLAFKMDIIDPKTGAVIFTSTKQAWDGLNTTTGRRAEGGTYRWVVTLTRKDNSKENFTGNISIFK